MLDLEPIKARLDACDFGKYVLYDDPAGAAERAEREIHRHCLADIPALVAEVERLTADNERLSAKLDAACEMGRDHITRSQERRKDLIAANITIERLTAENAQLRRRPVFPCEMCDNGDGHLRHACPRA